MRPYEQVEMVVALAASGKSPLTIARETGIPRSTIKDWVAGRLPSGRPANGSSCPACGAVAHRLDELPPEYVYLLGLYLGDGCILAHPRGVYRLRLFFDARHPSIIDAGEAAVRSVFPANRVNRLSRCGGYANSAPRSNVELSVYSKAPAMSVSSARPGPQARAADRPRGVAARARRAAPGAAAQRAHPFGRMPLHQHGPQLAASALRLQQPLRRHPRDLPRRLRRPRRPLDDRAANGLRLTRARRRPARRVHRAEALTTVATLLDGSCRYRLGD